MAVNFPNNPTVGQTYTLGSRTWQWTGTFWRAISTTVGYTGSRGRGVNFVGNLPTESDLPLPYSGEENDAYVVEATGILWIWDGSSWGPVGQFTGYTGSQGAPGTSIRLLGSVATEQDLPSDGTSDGSTLLLPGDGFIVQSSGDLYIWSGTSWSNVGKIAGDAGPIGFTGSAGFTGSTGFTGSIGESSFTWGDTPPPNPAVGDRWYDTITGCLTVYVDDGDSLQWVEVAASGFVGQQGYTGSGGSGGPRITSIAYEDGALATDPAGGETVAIVGSGFEPNAHVLLDGATVGVVTYVSSTRLEFVAPAKSAGSYAYLYVINEDGGVGIHVPGVQYSGVPSWSSPAAGSLGNVFETQNLSQSFVATSNSAVTYSVQAGTLPQGSSLNTATGILSGTLGNTNSPTTYTFVIRATDAELQTTDRQFSITLDPDAVTWVSPANSAVIEVVVDEPSTTTLSATSAAGNAITYSASALPTGLTLTGDTVTGTATVLDQSVPSDLTAASQGTNKSATVSITWSVVLGGDPFFKNTVLLLSGDSESFITDASTNGFNITPVGDTRPSAFSPYNTSWSNYQDSADDYLTTSLGADGQFGTSNFTIECWVYMTTNSGIINPYIIDTRTQANWAFSFDWSGNQTATELTWTTQAGVVIGNSTAQKIPLNRWTHCAYVRLDGVGSLYINGQIVASAADTSNYSVNVTTAFIGRRHSVSGGNYQSFPGYLADLRIVNGQALASGMFTPPTSRLTTTTVGWSGANAAASMTGTVGLLMFNQNRFVDSANSSRSFSAFGTPVITAVGPFTDTDTSTGSGYFDGTGDYLTVNNFNGSLGAGDYTIEFWFNTNDTNNFEFFAPTASLAGPAIIGVSTTTLSVQYQYGSGTGFSWTTGDVFDNNWHHLALVRNGTTVTLYVDGVSKASGTNSPVTDYSGETTNWTLGFGNQGAGRIYLGYMSNFRVVAGTAVYTGNFTPPTEPLTAISGTQLLTLQNRVSYNNSQPIDESGIKNVVTRNGNASAGTFSPHVPTGWSAYFDGTGDYLSSTGEGYSFGSGDFTIEAWVYPTALPSSDYGFFVDTRAGGTNNGFSLWMTQTNGYLGLFDGPAVAIVNSTSPVPLNQWSHVALVRNGSSLIAYLNGVNVASRTTSSSTSGNTLFVATARDAPGSSRNHTGYISNLRIVKGTAVYTSAFTPPTAPLEPVARTSFLSLRGPGFTDDGPNRFAITRNGDTRITPFSPFAPHTRTPDSYSVYFDGTEDYLLTSSSVALGTNDFTVELWVNFLSLSSSTIYQLFGNANTLGSTKWRLGVSNTLVTFGGSTSYISYDYTSTIQLINNWTHIAVTRSSNTYTLYINGVSRQTADATGNDWSSNLGIYIASNGTSAGHNAYVSNARVVNGTAIYTSNFTPPTAPLTAISGTSLLTCQSPTITDNSTNAFALTVNGNTQPARFNPFGETVTTGVEYSPVLHGGSVYFDGTGDYLSVPNINFSTNNFTIEGWFYPFSIANTTNFWGIDNGSGSNPKMIMYINASGNLVVDMGNAGTTQFPISVSATANINVYGWNHIALVRYGLGANQLVLFINGKSVASGQLGTNISNITAPFNIGYIGEAYGIQFSGYISNFLILNGTALYTSAFVPPQAPATPIAGTTLLVNGTNAAIQDRTGRNVLETAGNVSVVKESPFRSNNSVLFVSSYLQIAHNSAMDVFNGDYTVEAWIYSTQSQTASSGIAGKGGSSSGWTFNVSDTTLLVNMGGSTGVLESASGSIVVGRWHHVAFSRTGTTVNLFLDGALIDTATRSINDNTTANLRIGTNRIDSSKFRGYISNFRIVSSALYTGNFTPPTSPLTAISNTVVLTCQSKNYVDNSSNAFAITVDGSPRVTGFGPFSETATTNNSLSFDGTGNGLLVKNNVLQKFGTGDFTIECWMNTTATGTTADLFGQLDSGGTTEPCLVRNSTTLFWQTNYGGTNLMSIAVAGLFDGAWHHVAMVRYNGVARIYLDGVSVVNANDSTDYNSVGDFALGAMGATYGDYQGYIDDFRITKGIARYTANFTPPAKALPLK